jgi:hypothetical protein
MSDLQIAWQQNKIHYFLTATVLFCHVFSQLIDTVSAITAVHTESVNVQEIRVFENLGTKKFKADCLEYVTFKSTLKLSLLSKQYLCV